MGRVRRAIFAGFWGGMLAGVLDALAALLVSGNLLGFSNRLHVLAVGVGLGTMAGSTLAMVFSGWSFALEQLLGRSRWVSGAHAVALLLSSPLLVYDSFALFQGARAARIPAHHLLATLLIVLGVGCVWGAATLWGWLCARAESGHKRGALFVLGLALALFALATSWLNQTLLPRLYHWFHLSLALFELVMCVLGVRLLLATRRRVLDKRWSWVLACLAFATFMTATMAERATLARSQALRFFIHDKTQLASLFVRALLPPKTPPKMPTKTQAGPAAPFPDADAEPPLAQGPHRPDSDIVLITVDALRPDHLGCYGYKRRTTPNIDRLAARGVRFEHAYTQAPHTSFSLASLMIGKYYPTLARVAPLETHETLAKILRRYGWKTAAFFPPAVFFIDTHKMKTFESSNFDFEYVKYEFLDAEGRLGQIEDFLNAENPKKLFLWLHLFEPHEPYARHAGFDFGASDLDRYDSEIAYSDFVLGKLFALLEKKRPGAIVILAADHGEEFGEHGGHYHGTTLFEEQVRVPLIVAFPGLTPHAVSGPVELVDVSATILGLLDLPLPARMRGTDLRPWLAMPPAPVERLPPVFAELEDKRMVVLGTEKLICDVGQDFCSFFDLATDAGERHDRADARPERVGLLRWRLETWLGQQARYEANLVGAARGEGELARAIERARLGDASVALSLATMLRGDSPIAARREAASLLVTALPPKPDSKDALLAAASGADAEDIRDWAAVAAMRVGALEVRERLRTLVAKPASEATQALHVHAALALAEKSDAAGVVVLANGLDGCAGDVPLCKRMLGALGKLGDRRAVPALIEHLAFVQTRRETVEALSAIADTAAVPALIGRLQNDEYVPVRVLAAEALGRLGGARAMQALQGALAREKEASVLASIRAALAARDRGR
jgi:arylsulfatase A-like enzyme